MGEALAPEIEAVRQRLLHDTPFWAKHCATILDVQRRPVKLDARPWQARTPETLDRVTPLDEALETQRLAGRPQRAIVLKARKLGFSTWVQAKFVQQVTQRTFDAALTVAHRQDAGNTLFKMAQLMYRRLPTQEQLGELIYGPGGPAAPFSVRPQWLGGTDVAQQGGGYMTLGSKARPEEASTYQAMTAGGKGGGRSATPSKVHLSEAAHVEDPEFITGLFNALPLIPDTLGIVESTAKGFNHFFDLWDNAVRGAEDPETGILWMPLFYGWQDNPFNALPFISEQARDRFERTVGDAHGGGDEEEILLVEQFGTTLEQLNWRREIIKGPECRGKIDLFHQEHPATPEQAFIGSGQPVFSGVLVSRAIAQAQAAPEPVRGVLRPADVRTRHTRSGTIEVPQRAVWVPESAMDPTDMDRWGDSRLLVWEHPKKSVDAVRDELAENMPTALEAVSAALEQASEQAGQYVVFADIAQGLDTTSGVRDWSAVQVLDHVSRMQVARLQTRIAIHDLPILLLLIALYFNEATLATEVTGLGIGPTDVLAKDYRYRRMYRRRRAGDDQRTDQREQLIGWETTLRTKPLMEQTFGQTLADETLLGGIRDVATGREFTTYVEDDRGRHGAQKGAHDDLAISMMGVQRVASELRPRDPGKQRRSGRGRIVDDPITGY